MAASPLTADDPRYRELFDLARESKEMTGQVEGDLSPAMNALRDRAPVMKGSLRELLQLPEVHMAFDRPRDHYTILTFDLCDQAFRDNMLFSSHVYRESPGVQSLGHTILAMTGDEHLRYRRVVQPMFLRPRAATWWKPHWIEDSVEALVERLPAHGAVDLNMELCARLPVWVVTRGIGMEGENALSFRDHLHRSGSRLLSQAEREASRTEVSRMLQELITVRRAEPADDVISGLIRNDFMLSDGTSRKLDDEEVFGFCRLIMLAGGGTTWRQLGITLNALLSDYRWWEMCRDDRSTIGAAIEESTRWLPTDPTFPRLMSQDAEIGGVTLPAGARVDLCIGAANRDPSRWDNPDVFDPTRPAKYHLGFGLGPHQCLGMYVAKQEMTVALNRLMDRFPNMRLDPEAPAPELQGGLEQRGMSAVPVRLTGA